jgi:TIR domain
MQGKIFINYRRGDDPGHTGRLFDHLQDAFQPDQLFMDVDSIAPGLDFVWVLEEQVAKCDVLLAVIGRGWLDARDGAGKRRLDNADDFVRVEIEAGLRLGKRVIPVLVNDVDMPHGEDLPEPLRPLARRNAVRLTHDRFKADAQGLIKALGVAFEEVDAARKAAEDAATIAARQREAEEAKRAEESERAEKERARLSAIAGLSPGEVRKAEELANWEFIKARDNIQDFRDHLARFPGGVTERYVRERLETAAWAGLASNAGLNDLKAFLVEFPDGAHAPEASRRVAELEREALAAQELRERQRQETEALAAASAAGDVAALRSFLNDWPNSTHSKAARSRIKEIEGVPARRWLLQGVGIVALVCLVTIAWVVPSYVSVQIPAASGPGTRCSNDIATVYRAIHI